jgi:raffinose/stachyose/melibiose transport system permease protein
MKRAKIVRWQRSTLVFILFLFPSLFAFFMVIIIPFIMGIYYSFTNWNAITGTDVEWVGLKNYIAVFKDITFLHSFLVTIAYSVLNIVLLNVCAFSMALLVTGKLKFNSVYRAGFFLPNLIGGLILGYIWQFIFNNAIPSFGEALGFTWLAENQFLANRHLALLAIVIVSTWQYAGYIMMIYVAAIQGIPDSLLEAAQIDGATYIQKLRRIVFPLVAPAFTVSMFLTLINSFKQFDVNFSLNIYNTAFAYRQLAQGQAKALVFFAALAVIALVQVRANKKKEIEV